MIGVEEETSNEKPQNWKEKKVAKSKNQSKSGWREREREKERGYDCE